jgi:aminopeptidase N
MSHYARFASLVLLLASLITAWPNGTLNAQDRRGAFTAPPRSVRSRDIDQQHLKLEMMFKWEEQEVYCIATHKLATFKPLREIKLDAAELRIIACSLKNGDKTTDLKHEHRGHELTIQLDQEYPAASELQVTVAYKIIKPKHGVHFVVPDESEPDQPKMVWTQCEPEYARYWYPCFDSPSDRLTSEIIATVPKQYMTLSNGVLKDKQDEKNDMRTWHWVQAKSHVPYLMSFVAGDFEALEQKWNEMPVLSYVPRGRGAEAPISFEKTPKMVEFFSQKIGLKYPWEKYAQICVDEYQWGGMEHTSATTLTLRTLHDERAHLDVSSDNLVAHELAHQWWGDLLTCKDWGELWLNESFATYFATLWTEHDQGWDEASWDRRSEANDYMDEDGKYRRPIVTYRYPSSEAMFDRHTYPKGGRVLHMLRFVLGDDAYWKAIHRYAEVNQFRTVETADLRRAIEESTGQGLNWFFDQWVHRGGHPEFDVRWEWDDASKNAVLTVKQAQKVDDLTPLFRMPVEIEIATGTATQIKRIEVSKAEETFHFALDARPSRIVFDPKDWLLKKLKCDKSKEEWIDQLTNCQHVIARAQAVEALKGMKDYDDVEAALVKAAKSDAFWGVREEAVKSLGGLNNDAVRNALLESAAKDSKSHVRRAAIEALGNFAHDDVRKQLRTTIAEDKSYFAIADAIRALMKIDRDKMRETLLAALDTPSHDHVVLKAACDGLVDLKADEAIGRLTKKLDGKLRPEERAIVISALARLKPTDEETLAKLKAQLNNDRLPIRRAAIETIVSLNNPAGIAWLQEQRGREEHNRMLRNIDEAIEKLRNGQKPVSEVQREVEELRKKNRELEERLKKVESKS